MPICDVSNSITELFKVEEDKHGSLRHGGLDLLKSTIHDECPLKFGAFETHHDKTHDGAQAPCPSKIDANP